MESNAELAVLGGCLGRASVGALLLLVSLRHYGYYHLYGQKGTAGAGTAYP
jgi:hypothetical protein